MDKLLVDIGSKTYTSVTKQFKLKEVPVFQFRIAENVTSLVLNVGNLGCEVMSQQENCRVYPLSSQITNSITANGTIVETEEPYGNNEFWGKHVRCQPGESVWYRFLWFELESCCDSVALTYGNQTLCDRNYTLNSWYNTKSEILIVSFNSDGSVVDKGFKIETQCLPETVENEALSRDSTLLQCFRESTNLFIQPVDVEDQNDYTDCVRRDYFNITDLCDGGKCQMPKGAFCPGNQWFTPSERSARILGGKPAIPHSWPWIVQLVDRRGDVVCGGTLITDKWVLTAAHCCEAAQLSVNLSSCQNL